MIRIAHVETNITLACQNRCVACNHLVTLQAHDFKSTFAQPEIFARDLRNLGRIAHVDVWAAIGGEPLLHPAIVEFLRIADRSPTLDVVEVRTNGQALLEQPRGFWALVDRIVVTPYPGKLDAAALDEITERCRHLAIELEIHAPHFVRLLEPPVDAAKAARKFRTCWFKTFCRVLDGGWLYRCCTTPFIPKLLLGLPEGTDGIRIDSKTSEELLRAYLDAAETPASCTVCCGMSTESTRPIVWEEIAAPARWLAASGMGDR